MTYGHVALLRIKAVHLLVADIRQQVFSWRSFEECGIDPRTEEIVVVKSTIAFRKSFEEIASQILDVRCPGLAEQTLEHMGISQCRNFYPLNPNYSNYKSNCVYTFALAVCENVENHFRYLR